MFLHPSSKPHFMKWEVVCSTKSKGGLGVRSLFILSRTLLCKWIWRFAIESSSTKFGVEEGGWFSQGVRDGFVVRLWKEIIKEGPLICNNIVFLLGNGRIGFLVKW